jgi:hypothetical protein
MVREHWRRVLEVVGVVGTAAAIAVGVLVATGGASHERERGVMTENGRASEAFDRHEEDVFAAKVDNLDSPTSWAEEEYQLNGGDMITADQIAGARAASAAIAARGVGKGKNSTTSWFSLGPTNAVYPQFLNRHGSQYNTSGRITALEISPDCTAQSCTLWVGAAGGGVWRTNKALSGNANWVNVSDGYFASGAIGALTYDGAHHTLYAGTGEDAAAGDAEAGVGVYKSTDGGDTWTPLGGNTNFLNRAIRQIAVDPNDPTGNTIYVADGRGVHGISSTTAGAVSQIPPGTPGIGVWKSADGGATFTLLRASPVSLGPQPGQTFLSSFGSSRGATDVAVDPTHPGVIYASAYNVGVWRSTDNGATWTQIHGCQTCGGGASRSEFALATADGHTRMYQTEGDTCSVSTNPPNPCTSPTLTQFGTGYSRLWVANAVESGAPVFVDKTSANKADPGWATWNFCTGQCWYDELVYSPKGQPDTVFVMGSYEYGEDHGISNARGLLMSTDGGNTFTDLTDDATGTDDHHDGLHPDQHAFVTNPNDPNQFFEGSDGGLMRSNGSFSDISDRCDGRGLEAVDLARCKQLLSRVPSRWDDLNVGLDTLQFQALSVNPADAKDIQGGTQDNGTFETSGSAVVWPQTIFGDGGLSGFDATDRSFRFHTYFSSQVEVNFQDGHDRNWDWIADPFFDPKTGESSLFYFPIITDATVHGTMFAGLSHVWRTKDDGGPQAYLDSNCNRFTGTFTKGTVCGDWVKLGDPSPSGRLTSGPNDVCPNPTPPPASVFCPPPYPYGTDRSGGNVSWVSRAPSDNSTLWAATTRGRVFVSKNADADPESAVSFTRLDSLAANSPGRPISGIAVDPANPNHAYISYLSYNALTSNVRGVTPLEGPKPGHVFSVTYDPVAGTATWVSLDGPAGGSIGDQPVNGVAYDLVKGDLYASTDFGVAMLAGANPASSWLPAASGLPVVTVAGLTINASARQLLAATHGRGAYQLTLP